MNIFDELDKNKEGSLDHAELRSIFSYMGLSPSHSSKIFKLHDTNGDGTIDRSEWLNIVDHVRYGADDDELKSFMEALQERYEHTGHIYEPVSAAKFILKHDSRKRAFWDSLLIILLVYISLSLPLTFAFEGMGVTLRPMDVFVDCVFMLDVLLNFNTTYINKNMEVVEDQGHRLQLFENMVSAGYPVIGSFGIHHVWPDAWTAACEASEAWEACKSSQIIPTGQVDEAAEKVRNCGGIGRSYVVETLLWHWQAMWFDEPLTSYGALVRMHIADFGRRCH